MELVSVRKYLLIIFSSLLILSACGSSDDETEEVNGENEESNIDEIDRGKMNSEVMKLGETGLVDNGISRYEITPKSFEIFRERDGITPYNDDEVFVLIDYTIKNVDEEAFKEEDILIGAGLFLKNSQGDEVTEITYYDYDFVDKITESIEPGQSYDSQLLFQVSESEASEYTLNIESYSPDVEDAEWFFTESEAK
jgi:hypothetical protein